MKLIRNIMKTKFLRIILCFTPLFFTGAPTQEGFITPNEAREMMEQHAIDQLDLQFQLYESGIEMNLSEIKYALSLKKQPFKIVE